MDRRRLLGLVVLVTASGLCHAMWIRLTDAELRQQSTLIIEGEWTGEGPWPGRPGPARVGRIMVSKVWKGRAPGAEVLVERPSAGAPLSSSDLQFRPGDRGLWFLNASTHPGGEIIHRIDHPQRFMRDSPDNAAAVKAWRERLAR